MPRHQQITATREKAKRIRDYAAAFRQEHSIQRVAQIHTKTEKKDISVFVVKLPITDYGITRLLHMTREEWQAQLLHEIANTLEDAFDASEISVQ